MPSRKPETVKVCIRTRPTPEFADALRLDTKKREINVHLSKAVGGNHAINNQQEDWKFSFSHLLHNASQEDVYQTAAQDIVTSVLEGYNGTILAYGQTGAGKTFTMMGGTKNYSLRGITPRAIGQIFRAVAAQPETSFVIKVSYLEVYNEQFFDLLTDQGGGALGDLAVRMNDAGNVEVKGLSKRVAENEESTLNLLFQGETNRAIGEHQMNKNSTRSHCVFTIYVESRSRVESSEKVIFSKLNLVDLAGSERVGKTGSTGVILEEAKYINKSLTFLEQVVVALGNKNRDHIPFRQSKLTNVLRDSLGGNCKTRLIANIWAERRHIEETISTLKFATRMMRVANVASVNVQVDPVQQVRKFQREIKELKQELAMHDTLANRAGVSYESFTPEQQVEMRDVVQKYLRSEVQDIEVINLRQIREVFKQFKNCYDDLQAQMGAGGWRTAGGSQATGLGATSVEGAEGDKAEGGEDNFVGEVDDSAGFSAGLSASHARPAGGVVSPTKPTSAGFGNNSSKNPFPGRPGSTSVMSSNSNVELSEAPPESVAFEEYKLNEGAEAKEQYLQNKVNLKKKKKEFRAVSLAVNSAKREIDDLNERLRKKRVERADQQNQGDVEVIDEEEFDVIRCLKSAKAVYMDNFASRKQISQDLTDTKNLVEQTKIALANEFLAYYREKYEGLPGYHSAVAPAGGSGADGGDRGRQDEADVLDDGEKFEKMEMDKIMMQDPESISFYKARKNLSAMQKQAKRTKGARKPHGQGARAPAGGGKTR